MDEMTSSLENKFASMVYQTELERIRYLIKSYLRTRLFKRPSLAFNSRELPEWLNGILYRIDHQHNTTMISHTFDGMPFLHRFQLSSSTQTVRYNSRHLATKAEQNICQGNPTAFFGHVYYASSTWALFKAFLSRFKKFVIEANLVSLNNGTGDPSSVMVGVTVTPNFPIPKSLSQLSSSHPILVTKTDANVLQKVNSDNLVPENIFNYSQFDKQLSGELSAAHHQYDPATEENFNFTLKMGPTPTLIVFSTTQRSSQATILAKITHRLDAARTPIRSCYIHSFWLTKNYIIIPEAPLFLRNTGLDFIVAGSVLAGMEWDPHTPTFLHVISRRPDQGHIASIPMDSFFTFHTGNAWEENALMTDNDSSIINLHLDCSAFPDGDIMYQLHSFGQVCPPLSDHENKIKTAEFQHSQQHNGFTKPPIRQSTFGELRRYTLAFKPSSTNSTSSCSATSTLLTDNFEFLRFNQKYAMQPYRYIYGNQLVPASQTQGEHYTITKVDLTTKETIVFKNADYVCSEPIFVPRPAAKQEDDGVLLSFVNVMDHHHHQNDGKKHCFLLVLEASNMKELARCKIGHFSATTFHGSFVDYEFRSISIN
ncbi:carotenoid oxygenase [Absidia repens]|uniref:Carotenoid oxygenase n=1 Tax=Absidia repens TaxID=90262 RepID=A0A1X2HZS1_9FUNG|nr:carotenoid oxygenase [Absidia repens]